MRYRPLSNTGDYTVGLPFLINSPQCVAQAISTRLKLWMGEWFLDNTIGTPWLQHILGRSTNPDAYIRTAILGTPGVVALVTFGGSYDSLTRTLTIEGTVASLYGLVAFSTSLTVPGQ